MTIFPLEKENLLNSAQRYPSQAIACYSALANLRFIANWPFYLYYQWQPEFANLEIKPSYASIHFHNFCTHVPDSIWYVLAQDKPLLSTAIKEAIDAKGAEEAKKYFEELSDAEKANYTVDMQGVISMATEYSQAGDITMTTTIMEIASPFMSTAGPSQGAREAQAKREERKAAAEQEENRNRGEKRTDLDRFSRFFTEPGNTDERRYVAVQPTCVGYYLVFGSMWGDASPSYLKSTGALSFTNTGSFQEFSIQIDLDGDGTAMRITHDHPSLESPLEYIKPLSGDFEPCVSTER